jgi:hypothetical protein
VIRTKRENLLLLVVATVIVVYVLDQFVYTPYAEARDKLIADQDVARGKQHDMREVFRAQRDKKKTWHEMTAGGIADSIGDARAKTQPALSRWASESGVGHFSLRTDATSQPHGYVKVVFHASGSGQTSSVAKLLWAIESSGMPIRVDDIHLTPGSGKEASDDVQMQLTVSRLCATNAPPQPGQQERPDAARPSSSSPPPARVASAPPKLRAEGRP